MKINIIFDSQKLPSVSPVTRGFVLFAIFNVVTTITFASLKVAIMHI